jgi:hypothetical protein
MVAQAAKRPDISEFSWSHTVTRDNLRCHIARRKVHGGLSLRLLFRSFCCDMGSSMISNQCSPVVVDQHVCLSESALIDC